MQTVSEALLVLDAPGQTEGRLIYEMGEWDTPSLVTLLDELLPTANSRITKSSTIFSELSFGGINHYAAMGLIFLVVAIIAEVFGFSGAAGEAAWTCFLLLRSSF